MAHRNNLQRCSAIVVVAAALLCATPAAAQVPGEGIHLETTAGPVDGTLIDRVPEGYLVRVGDQSRVVPYRTVVSISAASASPAPPAPLPAAALPQAPPGPVLAPPRLSAEKAAAPAPTNLLYRTGSGLAALGLLGAVVGAVLIPTGMSVKSAGQCTDVATGDTYDCDYRHGGRMITAGAVSLAAGGALLVAGIPLMAVGRRQALRDVEQPKAAAIPAVSLTAGSASLVWRF